MTGSVTRRGFLRTGAGAATVGILGPTACSRSPGTDPTTVTVTESPRPVTGIPERTQYSFPPEAEPFAKDLHAAGIPIVYGPNPVPPPAAISQSARDAWRQLSQMPLPPDDPAKLAVVRQFSTRTEEAEFTRLSATHTFEDRTIDGITTLRISPGELRHPDKVVLFIHGGAWIINSRKGLLSLQCAVADTLGVPVVSVEYRLAPEHPYPAALDDLIAAYTEILKEYPPQNVGLLGVSAGGGLALATLLRLKGDGLPLPGAAAALCPGADMTHSGYLFDAVGLNDPVLSPHDIDASMRAYVGSADPTDPLVSPVFGDFTGAPPLFLLATTAEIIGSDAIRVASAARGRNVDVTLSVSDGMWHVPIADNTGIPELQIAYDDLIDFYRRHLQIAP